LRDDRTFKLYETVGRLLRKHDHEQISVAQLTQTAGVSVGAFYRRYRDKATLSYQPPRVTAAGKIAPKRPK
jgi:AcrR family transcriptional regulator